MHYVFEAIFIGIYTWIHYILLSNILVGISSFEIPFFFILGFLKHFLGGVLQLHTYYCNYGDACSSSKDIPSVRKYGPIDELLFVDSLLEGIIFVVIGFFSYRFLLSSSRNYPLKIHWIWIFMVGFSLHIIFEGLGRHHWFCKNRCMQWNGVK
jgi:hypothetical protein